MLPVKIRGGIVIWLRFCVLICRLIPKETFPVEIVLDEVNCTPHFVPDGVNCKEGKDDTDRREPDNTCDFQKHVALGKETTYKDACWNA